MERERVEVGVGVMDIVLVVVATVVLNSWWWRASSAGVGVGDCVLAAAVGALNRTGMVGVAAEEERGYRRLRGSTYCPRESQMVNTPAMMCPSSRRRRYASAPNAP